MPFSKGDPNINRNGRPQGSVSIVDAIRRKLEQEIPEEIEKKIFILSKQANNFEANRIKKKWLDAIVETVFKNAILKKDVAMLKDIIDRVDGKPKQSHEIEDRRENKELEILNEIADEIKQHKKNNKNILQK